MIAYILNKPLDCNKICYDIQQLINSQNSETISDKVLTISVCSIVDAVPEIPRLEHELL